MQTQLLTAFAAGLCVIGAVQLAPGALAPKKAVTTAAAQAPAQPPKPVVTLTIGEAPSPNHDERPAGTASSCRPSTPAGTGSCARTSSG